jgi:hypothetical protein
MVKGKEGYNVLVSFDGEHIAFTPVPLPVDNETIFATFEEAREVGVRLCEFQQNKVSRKMANEKQRLLGLTEEKAYSQSKSFQ